jgi:hypothetical protein
MHVAEQFMLYSDGRGEPCVLWEIHVDPASELSPARRCNHVSYVKHSNVASECEYLFARYLPFTAKEVSFLKYQGFDARFNRVFS